MTQTTNTLTHDEMTETLFGRAEEIFLLCAILTRRGLAHAFCQLLGHVDTVKSRIFPIDADYRVKEATPPVANLDVTLKPSTFLSVQDQRSKFGEVMRELDTYVSYLDFLIEKNTPVLTVKQENEA